jgi:hypothetical protein
MREHCGVIELVQLDRDRIYILRKVKPWIREGHVNVATGRAIFERQ